MAVTQTVKYINPMHVNSGDTIPPSIDLYTAASVDALIAELEQAITDITDGNVVIDISNNTVITDIEADLTNLWTTLNSTIGTLNSHTGNTDIHVLPSDKTNWNGKADLSYVQNQFAITNQNVSQNASDIAAERTRAMAAESANTTLINTHIADVNRHVSDTDRDNWTTAATDISSHIGDTTVHVTSDDKTRWDNKANMSDITTAINAEQIRINALLQVETDARIAGDTALQTAITAEETRAKQAEQANAAAIIAEKNRAEAAEQANTTLINNEVANRQNADTALQNQINAHVQNVNNPHSTDLQKAADITQSAVTLPIDMFYTDATIPGNRLITLAELQASASTAMRYKGQLKYGTNLQSEMSWITNQVDGDLCGCQETGLTYKWNASTSTWDEEPHGNDVTGDLYDILFWYGVWENGQTYHGEVMAQVKCRDGATHAFDLLVLTNTLLPDQANDGIIGNRQLVDNAANGTLAPTTAKTLTAWLQIYRDNLKWLFQNKANSVDLNNEIATARQAEQANAAAIAQEIIDRQNGDAALQAQITANTNGLAQEIIDRQNGDTALQNAITAEASTARQAEQANATAIALETSRAMDREAELQTAIDTETQRATSAEQAHINNSTVHVTSTEKTTWNNKLGPVNGNNNEIIVSNGANGIKSSGDMLENYYYKQLGTAGNCVMVSDPTDNYELKETNLDVNNILQTANPTLIVAVNYYASAAAALAASTVNPTILCFFPEP